MNARQLAIGAGVTIAVGLLLAGLRGDDGGTGLAAAVNIDLEVPAGDSNAHPCHPATIGDRITGRHPLYRRPSAPGVARSMLALGGWGWYLNPPSEAA